MYTEHFNLVARPFSRVPSANACVMYPGMKSCFERAAEGIGECAGPVLIVGPSGSGKSTLLALLENRFQNELTVVTLNCASIDSRQELIQCLLFELSLPFNSDSVGELRLTLIDHLKSPEQCPHGLLLMVDEAHNLPPDVLEELRMITNIVCGSQHQIRLVIAGGRSLEEKLGHPQLESFSQRIGVRCYLQNMTRTETMFFALAQIQMCGRDGREIFQPSALEKIFDITDGVPRLVTHLADHTLKMAAQQELEQVDAKLVQQAWLDIQQLPALPEMEELAVTGNSGGVIEFGSLDEAVQNSPESLASWPSDAGRDLVPPKASERASVTSDPEPVASTAVACGDPGDHERGGWDDASPAPDLVSPGESTLDSLLHHLNEIDESHDAEESAAEASDVLAPADEESVATAPGSPLAGRSGVETTSDIRNLQGFRDLPEFQNQAADNPDSLPPHDSGPVELREADPTVTQPFSFQQLPSSPADSNQPPVQDAQGLELDPTVTQPVPNLDAQAAGQETGGSPAEPPRPNPFDMRSDQSRTISTEELFGGSFEDEPVLDVQSSLLAAQNRASSSLTFREVAGLRPVDATNSDEGDDVGDEHSAGPPESSQSASQDSPHIADSEVHTPIVSHETPPVDVTQTWSNLQVSKPDSLKAVPAASDSTPNDHDDDSDMLIVEHESKGLEKVESPEEAAPPTSQGQVIRMDYQDLFQQLRNQNPGSQT